MNQEFHYYAVHFLAQQAGFDAEEAQIVAYSSQYLDNALVSYAVETERGCYDTLVTHHFGFWDREQEWDVWIPYHFFPAGPEESALQVNGAKNPLVVVPNSSRVKQLLVESLRTRDLYRVGIALHTYADAWAHQNFTGRREEWNRIDSNSPLPPIGHAQAMKNPDGVDSVWSDPRLEGIKSVVDNRARFMEAARRVYRYLATFNRRPFDDEELVMFKLRQILGAPGKKAKEERIADFVIECHMDEYRRTDWRYEAFDGEGAKIDADIESTYDKILWLKEEFLHKTRLLKKQSVKGKPRFWESNLYKWDQAARAHRRLALQIIADLKPAPTPQ